MNSGKLTVSSGIQNLLGLSGQFPDYAELMEMLQPDSQQKIVADVKKLIEENTPVEQDYKIRTLNQSKVIDIHIKILFDPAKRIIFGIVNDITDRKQAEEALQESEERFRSLFMNTTIGLYRISPEGQILMANPTAVRMMGFKSFDELAARNREKEGYETSFSRSGFRDIIEKEGEIIGFETSWIRQDGEVIYVRESARAVRDSGESILYYEGTVEDISHRKLAENALRTSEQRLRMALQAAKAGAWEWDIVSNLTVWSDENFRVLGLNPETSEASLENWQKCLHPDDLDITLVKVGKSLQSGENFDVEFRVIWPDQSIHWINDKGIIINDETGKPVKMVGIQIDITERRQFEEKLKENEIHLQKLNATKDKFFSIIAHDLKNPFNSILGFSTLISELVHENELTDVEYYASIIQKSSHQAIDLLGNLLEWSRTQTDRIKFNPGPVELIEMIAGVTQFLKSSAEQKSISVSTELPEKLEVLGDRDMINTILRNLISNAIKFTPEGGHIEISAVRNQHVCKIIVSDNGVGISKPGLESIFTIDTNFTTPGTNKEEGTGLGLVLCKEFAEKQGGTIGVESMPGKGSDFWFTIPCLTSE